jgi:Zn finger protein HypA/HybF involved in hydrogenase expression
MGEVVFCEQCGAPCLVLPQEQVNLAVCGVEDSAATLYALCPTCESVRVDVSACKHVPIDSIKIKLKV